MVFECFAVARQLGSFWNGSLVSLISGIDGDGGGSDKFIGR